MKRVLKLVLAVVGSLALLVVMFLWLMGSFSGERKVAPGKAEPKEPSAVGLKTVEVDAIEIPIEVEAVGTVVARDRAEIPSRIMATITAVYADAGDSVTKGQTLFQLDSRDITARLNQSRESLASAEAALEQANLDASRIERLYEKQSATKAEYDHSQSALKMARASVDAARAALNEATVNLSYAKIESPLNGRVIDRSADAGDLATPGKPLMSIYDPQTLRMEVSIREDLRAKVHLSNIVRVSIDSLGIELEGSIAEIVPASDASSRSFLIRVALPTIEGLYPGIYGRAWLPVDKKEVILVPPDAIRHTGQLDMVTAVENGAARSRTVKLGETHPNGVEVLSGLSPGERIVVP